MTPRALAEIAVPAMRKEFDRVFTEHEAEFESNYDRAELRLWVLGYVAKAIWNASQGEKRNEHAGSST